MEPKWASFVNWTPAEAANIFHTRLLRSGGWGWGWFRQQAGRGVSLVGGFACGVYFADKSGVSMTSCALPVRGEGGVLLAGCFTNEGYLLLFFFFFFFWGGGVINPKANKYKIPKNQQTCLKMKP